MGQAGVFPAIYPNGAVFLVGKGIERSVVVKPESGIREGDPLSLGQSSCSPPERSLGRPPIRLFSS